MAVVTKGASKAQKSAAAAPAKSTPSWMKKGAAAQAAMEQEEVKDQQRQEANNRMWRFWLSPGETAQITFLDGKLDGDGVLDAVMYFEHQIQMNGSWGNYFTCVQEQEPCPVCEGGADSRLVAAFTIIDHREFKGKKGTYKNTRKLFVCKKGTLKILQLEATKRGGLAGCTFDVTRSSDNEVNVGNVFSFTARRLKKAEIADAFDMKIEDIAVADYEVEIPYRTADELRELGFGGKAPIGKEQGVQETQGKAGASASYEDDL